MQMLGHQHSLMPLVDKLIRHTPLSSEDCTALNALPYRLATFKAGSYLTQSGSETQHCCVILSGFAFGSRVTGTGNRQIVSIYMQGDLANYATSVMPLADYSTRTLGHADVAYIPHHALLTLAAEQPAIGRALWRDSSIETSIAREWMVNLGRRDARQRVSHFICEMAYRQREAGLTDGNHILWPMTQEQVADVVGLTDVHVNRTLKGLREENPISTGKKKLFIMKSDDLQNAGDFRSSYLHRESLLDLNNISSK
jgi:CRP-like cAMP-binding protein